MTDAYIENLMSHLDVISGRLDQNKLITKTRSAVQNGLKKFAITEAEKAKLYASFEIQFSLGVVNKLLETVLQADLLEQQVQVEIEKIALTKKQTDLVAQQILTELQTTTKVQNEAALLSSNKTLVDAQVSTEAKRKLDVMSGIELKNEQMLAARQSALFEEARRIVLIKSTLFNNQIQKSKEENALLNSLALDDAFIITAEHFSRVQTAMDNISTTEITYTTALTTDVPHVDPGT